MPKTKHHPGIPTVAGRPGGPRRRPDAVLGDKGYDSNPGRTELHDAFVSLARSLNC
ncbi:hypothetical protein [Streptomyces sp. RB17]|uniref:hypothetical protein n=1 Tax=Streptomyces sp. RB17 TaxID=2585197 RepID=UPI001E2EB171|nr:hypothetical protein [Streptomyces sp. RB17]